LRLRHFAAGAALAAFVGTTAFSQDKPPVFVRAEQCLRENVDRVVAADPGLTSATSFLLNYRCAAEVEAVARYQRNLNLAQLYNSMTALQPPGARKASASASKPSESVDPETGEMVVHPAPSGARRDQASVEISQLGSDPVGQLTPEVGPVALRRFAGDLVLETRERRIAKGQ